MIHICKVAPWEFGIRVNHVPQQQHVFALIDYMVTLLRMDRSLEQALEESFACARCSEREIRLGMQPIDIVNVFRQASQTSARDKKLE